MILGTAAYMAPEQARGKTVDKRADIWAFGVVLYEMVTGKRLFEGETISDILAGVLKSEPDLMSVPPQVRRLLKQCLTKDPKKRLRDIGDAMALIDSGNNSPAQTIPPAQNSWLGWGVAALLLLLAAPLAFFHFRETAPETQPLRATILPPEDTTFRFYGTLSGIAPPELSPDGRRLVFGARDKAGKSLLWIRQLDADSAQPLAGTEEGIHPFWSPDSKRIGFFAGGQLKKIDAAGGSPFPLCSAPTARGGTWNQDGIIVFEPGAGTPLERVSDAGGAPVPLKAGVGRWPWFLPDGHHFLFLASGVQVGSIDSQETKPLLDVNSNAVYAHGRILYLRENVLMAQAFDAKKLALSGEPVPIQDNVRSAGAVSRSFFSISQTGLLIYQAGSSSVGLTWFGRDGKKSGEVGEPGAITTARLSPDGKWIAASIVTNRTNDIWLFDVARGIKTRFTFFNSSLPVLPVWSPDAASIAFIARTASGQTALFRKSVNTTGSEESLAPASGRVESWSPDGKYILVVRGGKWKLSLVPLAGDRQPVPFAEQSINANAPQFSPDGHWVAYTAQDSDDDNIFIVPFPGPGRKVQVSNLRASMARWRRDGKEIFFRANGGVMAAELNYPGGAIQVGQVKRLFSDVIGQVFDVAADGQRFLLAPPVEKGSESLTLVQNWAAALKK
jgi:Tol biopolymer transport system component